VIRIVRAAEPAGLSAVRKERVEAAREAVKAGAKISFAEYDIVKKDLASMQHQKCCYCEKREEQAKYRDVEHYRPKSPYWWLAWTWENLLFSCMDCNREHKRDQFPLEESGSVRLQAEQAPPGAERPLVLDPSEEGFEPTTHIEFRREKNQGRERWRPWGLTERGRTTIEVCGLDRPSLLDLYGDHVVRRVRPRVEPVIEAARREDARAVVEAWSGATRGILGPMQPFRALSFDAVRVLVSPQLRAQYRLELERPA
jgi:uncharacterized protein (TIGR02646 family)